MIKEWCEECEGTCDYSEWEDIPDQPHLHIKIFHPDVSPLILPALEFKDNYKKFYAEEDIELLEFEPIWLSDIEYGELGEFES